MDLKEIWLKLESGESVNDEEMVRCLWQAKQALPYLESRLPRYWLAWNDTVRKIAELESYLKVRQEKNR